MIQIFLDASDKPRHVDGKVNSYHIIALPNSPCPKLTELPIYLGLSEASIGLIKPYKDFIKIPKSGLVFILY
ncbi:Uncharacterised protein [Legionella hackeliae]|uniref:Uncharacterized protein n=1 Tax=Legionella hackeliae TaxID=449 RepID=A0A0A8UN81_LEGHA|nr:hypothetical protein Lhac_2977 [Legionella hackeliae]CEK10183.1 protein of unknown function [Legionella hackeliae]STX46907.1 Uncharacterised protein [Legionella hackeliae]